MTSGGVRPQRARRQLDGARVSARSLPVELSGLSEGEPRATVASRASARVTLRAASRRHCPWVRPALAAHTLDEQDSPAYGNVSRAGDECGVVVVYEATMARPPPFIEAGQGVGPRTFREEQ